MTALPLLNTIRCKNDVKGNPEGDTAYFFKPQKSNKKEKIGCCGLAGLLLTDDDKYRFTCVRDKGLSSYKIVSCELAWLFLNNK